MANRKPNATSKSDDARGAVVSQPVDAKMAHNFVLVWLDSNIDNDNDCQNTIIRLQRIAENVKTFTDGDKCIQFIEQNNHYKTCMIISGSLGQHIVPCIHDLSQVEVIFIFCREKKWHEQWAKDWSKIKGVSTDLPIIFEALADVVKLPEQNNVVGNVMNSDTNTTDKHLNRSDSSFMYTQILKEILLTIDFRQQQHFKEFIDCCREHFIKDEVRLNEIKILEKEYSKHTPVWWCIQQYSLYSMVNSALRKMDMYKIIKLGFFITDLHRYIEGLHSEQFSEQHPGNTFTVYLGQNMSKNDFEELREKQGGLMSFSTFLSTTKNRDISFTFDKEKANNPDSIRVLFVMKIDPSQSTVPFADITDVNDDPTNGRVFFSMNTVFRFHGIKPLDKDNRSFEVHLALTKDTDEKLRVCTERIRNETLGANGWCRLTQLLLKMDQFDVAERICNARLQQTKNHTEHGDIKEELGAIKDKQGKYADAIKFYEQALEIHVKTLPPNHPVLLSLYNKIGLTYSSMTEYSKAVSYYERAIAIQEKTLTSYHPDLASSYNNIGMAYNKISDFQKALSCCEKALKIRQRSLPSNHPDLALSYHNMALIYENMEDYSKACSFYEHALEIGQGSSLSNHPALEKWEKHLNELKKKV